MLSSTTLTTPLGEILLIASPKALFSAQFVEQGEAEVARREYSARTGHAIAGDESPILDRARRQLDSYFHGKRRGFSVPLQANGTPFQRRVWSALLKVTHGATASYGSIASQIGQPKASRAVAQACGRNPLVLFIPCHRIVAADGKLGGFSAGTRRKRQLLTHEGRSGSPLPLFVVARSQASEEQKQISEMTAVATLPLEVQDELQRLGDGLQGTIRDPEALIHKILESLEPPVLAPLVAHLSRLATATQEPYVIDATEALLELWTSRLLEHSPTIDGVRFAMDASIRLDSPGFERLGRRLNSVAQRHEPLMKSLAARYQQIMEGATQASSRHREIAVDLWLDLRGHVASEAWAPNLSEKPSRVLQDAGRLWEASVTAEKRLADGNGDRRELLGRLVSLYTELGEYEMAIQKLLAKMAEGPVAEDKELLRWLQDRLGGA